MDLFSNLAGTPEERQKHLDTVTENFNKNQKDALHRLRKLSRGLQIIRGPAGTGKTEYFTQLVALLTSRRRVNGAKNQVLITATKRLSDSVAAVVSERAAAACRQSQTAEPVVLRVGDKDNELLDHIKEALQYYELHKADVNAPSAGADACKIAKIRTNLGYHVARRTGLIQDRSFPSTAGYPALAEMLQSFIGVGSLPQPPEVEVLTRLVPVIKDVMRIADVVITTVSCALAARISGTFKPVLVVFDNAELLSEDELKSIVATYPTATVRICVGDAKNNKPITKTTLAPNRADSVFHADGRGHGSAYTSSYFVFQQRSVPDICNLLNHVWYENSIMTTATLNDSPGAIKARTWVKGMFNLNDSNIVVLDVKNSSFAQKLFANYHQAGVSASIVEALVKSNFHPSTIGSLCAYGGQEDFIKFSSTILRDELQKEDNPWAQDMDSLKVLTFDHCNGEEYDAAIVDLTVTNDPGYISDPARLLRACSRARNLLIIICNLTENRKIMRYSTSPIGRTLEYLNQRKLVVKWNGSPDKYLTPMMARLSPAGNHPEVASA